MDKVIAISDRAVADYGFRQAVLYGADDVARRWELSDREKSVLETTVLKELNALPVPVQPEDVSGEQARLSGMIQEAAQG